MEEYTSLINEFKEAAFFNYIGFEFVSVEKGKVKIRLMKRPEISNLQNMMHGGALMSGMDIVMGLTARTGGCKSAATIQMEVKFIKSLTEGAAEIIGELVHQSGNTAILTAKVIDEQGNLIAYSTGTFRLYK